MSVKNVRKRRLGMITFILAVIICAVVLMWYSDYDSDKVRVVIEADKYRYSGSAEVMGDKADINIASVGVLEGIPGIGPETAMAIVEYRNEHGAFGDIYELEKVRGIGKVKLEAIKEYVCVN